MARGQAKLEGGGAGREEEMPPNARATDLRNDEDGASACQFRATCKKHSSESVSNGPRRRQRAWRPAISNSRRVRLLPLPECLCPFWPISQASPTVLRPCAGSTLACNTASQSHRAPSPSPLSCQPRSGQHGPRSRPLPQGCGLAARLEVTEPRPPPPALNKARQMRQILGSSLAPMPLWLGNSG